MCCSCVVVVLQSSPTCLHLCADLFTAGSTHGVRKVTQYADTSCHGRGWKVWINIVCQKQMKKKGGGGGETAYEPKLINSHKVYTQMRYEEREAALPGKITQGREGNVQTEPPCQQLVYQSDHCTSGSLWAWPQGQQRELGSAKTRDQRCWVTKSTDFSSTHTGHADRQSTQWHGTITPVRIFYTAF